MVIGALGLLFDWRALDLLLEVDGAAAAAGVDRRGVGADAARSLGLDPVQVRSVAVDGGRGWVCAASSNLLLHGGVFCRDVPGHPSEP